MRRLAAPFAAGSLLALAFPPFDLGPLALVAPLPLLLRWRSTTAGRGATDGFVAGIAFFGILVSWAMLFGLVAYLPFVAALAAFWAGAGAVVGALSSRGVGSGWTTASVWVLFEALRGHVPFGGFPWGEVGYSAHDLAPLRALAGWGGVLLVSFVVVLIASWIADGIVAWRAHDAAALRRAGAAMAVTGVVIGLAAFALPATKPTGDLRVAVVQGNDLNRDLTPEEIADRYLPVNHFRLASRLTRPLDLVILPESSLDLDPRRDPFLADHLREIARRLDASVLANASIEVQGGRRLHNTNFFYGPDGTLQGTYVKQHLVPFGEYVPGRSLLGFVHALRQVPVDYAPGHHSEIFRSASVPFGNLICFESAFPALARGYARDGAEVLVVSTNNRSFERSANSAQHVAIDQLRAVETGRPVIHAGVSGISAFIDARGTVRTRTDLFTATTLVETVHARTGKTPYVRYGDWILVVAMAGVLLAVARAPAIGRFAARRERS